MRDYHIEALTASAADSNGIIALPLERLAHGIAYKMVNFDFYATFLNASVFLLN